MSDLTDISISLSVDCTDLLCPLPVYKAGIALNRMEQGQVMELITTDPGALEDIPALARQRGDELLSSDDQDGRQVFLLRRGGLV